MGLFKDLGNVFKGFVSPKAAVKAVAQDPSTFLQTANLVKKAVITSGALASGGALAASSATFLSKISNSKLGQQFSSIKQSPLIQNVIKKAETSGLVDSIKTKLTNGLTINTPVAVKESPGIPVNSFTPVSSAPAPSLPPTPSSPIKAALLLPAAQSSSPINESSRSFTGDEKGILDSIFGGEKKTPAWLWPVVIVVTVVVLIFLFFKPKRRR